MHPVKHAFIALACWVIRALLSLRYSIEVRGKEKLLSKQKGLPGILFLPNHTAEIDPVILVSILGSRFAPRPLVIEYFYRTPGLHGIMRWIQAMPVPNEIASANKWKIKQVEKMFHTVSELVSKGVNFLIYPSGRLKLTGKEEIPGGTLVHQVLKNCPQARVVLIRTTGLWGSRFSRALTGTVPNFGAVLRETIKMVFMNGIFFTPRRKVLIEIEPAPTEFPGGQADRMQMAQYLENWYNRYPNVDTEPLFQVPYFFWKKTEPLPQQHTAVPSPEKKMSNVSVSSEMQQKVYAQLAQMAHKSEADIQPSMHLSYDLGLDSLDIADLYIFLGDYFDISGIPHGVLHTVGDVLNAAAGNLEAVANGDYAPLPAMPEESRRPHPFQPLGETIPESFLLACERMDGAVACIDSISGPMTYRQLKRAICVFSQLLRPLPGSHIGILLPVSTAAQIAVLSAIFAGKTPVMFNWTVGVRAIDHGAGILNIQHVLSSYRFLSNLESENLGTIEDKILGLEDLRQELTWRHKLKGFYRSLRSSSWFVRKFFSKVRSTDPAVILFTSGTESLPKAVPLTHHNILSNQRAAFQCVELSASDSMISVLPPFHSFGFSITGLLPLLAGLKVCYTPDPTDSKEIARCIEHWQPTLFCSAPSFIRSLLKVAQPSQLESLTLTVSGAEKTPEDLFEKFAALEKGKYLIEGYGITECGPVVTLQRPGRPRVGVGQPLPTVDLCIFDSDTGKILETGSEGEIGIAGPSVFPGYMGISKHPFLEIEGKTWYRSGDRGWLDAQGNLILTGRIKRFVKIGGEMISLGGLEEELDKLAKENRWPGYSSEMPSLALIAKEGDDKPLLILFTTFPIAKEDINSALRTSGWGRIAKIAEVRTIEQIPLTGTGKTHYRSLEELLG